MTYEESYQVYNTEKEILEAVERDCYVAIAMGGNPDRIATIKMAGEKVLKEKGL